MKSGRRASTSLLGLAWAAALLACGFSGSTERREDPAPDEPPPQEIVIGPGDQGGITVTTNGEDTWPPSGPGCEELVRCCDEAEAVESSVTLFCRLSAAGGSPDCSAGRSSVRQYLTERGAAIPASCE